MSELIESYVRQPKGLGRVFRYLLWVLIGGLFLLPVFWMLSSALKPSYAIFASPPVWWPTDPQWSNFKDALTALPFRAVRAQYAFYCHLHHHRAPAVLLADRLWLRPT